MQKYFPNPEVVTADQHKIVYTSNSATSNTTPHQSAHTYTFVNKIINSVSVNRRDEQRSAPTVDEALPAD